jgi:integrase
MGSVYKRGGKLWIWYRDATGARRWDPTPFHPGEEARAQALLSETEAQAAAERRFGAEAEGPVTVARFAQRWLAGRAGLASHQSEVGRFKLHVKRKLGPLLIADVRPRHLIDLVRELREKRDLAPRSIHHVYGLLHVMFRDAVLEELITATPCVLTKAQLGRKEDRDPEWRATAVYTRDELEALISDASIPADRQLLYALAGIGALRFGEIAGLRWRHYDSDARPLGRLVVANSHGRKGTKTGVTRELPVHPALAAMLATWKLSGWAALVGRQPLPDDFLLPSSKLPESGQPAMRNKHTTLEVLHDDLIDLGRLKRRFHDLRRTMITLARADGARPDLLKMVTHGPSGNILDLYTSMPWAPLCEEVAKLKIERREGRVIGLPRVAQVGEITRSGVTVDVTVSGMPTAATIKLVTPTGFEPMYPA